MNRDNFWIIKPPNLFCGMGIKFDLRVYVLVTSVVPLRVYIYEEGLTRFATEEYTNNPDQIENNFIHLTNFSINKDSEKFVNNSNPEEPEGSKWTLTSLWNYFRSIGIEKEPIWENVKD